jgi:hypothetical protein
MCTLIKNNKKAKAIFIGLFLIVLAAMLAAIVFFASDNHSMVFAAEMPIKTAVVNTTSYRLSDNTGYSPDKTKTGNPFGSSTYTSVSIDALTANGEIVLKDTLNGIPAFGFIAGSEVSETGVLVDIKLKYNYPRTNGLGSDNWEIFTDTAEYVNGMRVGVINSGALVIQKSYDGVNWTWDNDATGRTQTNYHTTDFIKEFKPETYNGDNKRQIYQPSGADIMRGVYIRVFFAYGIKRSEERMINGTWTWITGEKVKETIWHYENILEETTFFLASDSAEVVFKNASTENLESDDASMSELVQIAGTIKSGHGTLSGFTLSKLKNPSLDVKYSFNGSSNWKTAVDGQFFSGTGKYSFRVKTPLGTQKEYDVYVDNRDVNAAIEHYFGANGLIAANSKRVFTTVDTVPVYVAGQTYPHFNAVNNWTMPVAGTITNIDTGQEMTIAPSREARTFTITEPGNYEAEFYSNSDYKTQMSGDAFHFIFKFIVIPDSNVPGPMINQEILNGLTGFSDLRSGYYGVTLPTAGTGTVTYAFADYQSAYSFAYECERGLVSAVASGYSYKDNNAISQMKVYPTQSDVLGAVSMVAERSVKHKFFDASNPQSYQTLSEFVSDISTLNLSQDVVVFSDDYAQTRLSSGEPFLNSRKYRYINSDGTVSDGTYDLKFIQAADFESNSITFVNTATGTSYAINYNESVSLQLANENAPSGRYKIIEKTKSNETVEYYGVYIKPGEYTGSLTVDIFDGENLDTHTLTRLSSKVYNARGLAVRGSENSLDPYAIMKIVKNGAVGSAQIYGIDEAKNIYIDENGEYEIYLIDRLGNSTSFVFQVWNAVSAFTVNFDTKDSPLSSQTMFVGQTITLPVPVVEYEMYEFAGWMQDGVLISGNTFTLNAFGDITLTARIDKVYVWLTFDSAGGSSVDTIKARVGTEVELPQPAKNGFIIGGFTTPDGVKHKAMLFVEDSTDLLLTAVWHYPQVVISLYDGELYNEYNAQVESVRVLPFPSKSGYTFIGWYYSLGSNAGRLYYGQINSVSNVPSIRLDALWKKNGTVDHPSESVGQAAITFVNGTMTQTIYADFGTAVSLPTVTEDGMVFFGWQYPVSPVSGTIYRTRQIASVPSEPQIVLYALFMTVDITVQGSPIGGGTTTSVKHGDGTTNGLNGFLESVSIADRAMFLSMITLCAALLAAMEFFVFRKRRECIVSVKIVTRKPITIAKTENAVSQHSSIAPKAERTAYRAFKKHYFDGAQPTPHRGFWKTAVPVICSVLILVMGAIFILEKMPVGIFATRKETMISVSPNTYALSDNYYISKQDTDPKHNVALPSGETLTSYLSATVYSYASIDSQTSFSSPQSSETLDHIGLSNEEIFLFTLVTLDYFALGYNVFPAVANKQNGTQILGLAYSKYDEFYQDDNSDDNLYVGAGFVAFPNQESINESDIDAGVIIKLPDGDDQIDESGFILSFTENYNNCHFVAFDTYYIYGINGTSLICDTHENIYQNYIAEYGSVYSYDLGRVVFDPQIGVSTIVGATPLNASTDYILAQEAFRGYIAEQNANGLVVDTVSSSYISLTAINEYMLNAQNETFLGISADDIALFESQLSATQYYYVTEDGQMIAAEFPLPPTPQTSWGDRLWAFVAGAGMIIVGIVVTVVVSVVSCGAAAPFITVFAGSCFGAGMEVLSQAISGKGISQINWLKVGVAAVSGALCAIPGVGWAGASLIGGATNAVMTAIDGGSLEDCLKSFAIGLATGVLIHGATKLLGKVSSGVANKLGKCFVAGTGVLVLADGILMAKPIEKIQVGDIVPSYNEFTQTNEFKIVTETFQNEHNEVVKVKRSDNQTITSSVGHPYFTQRGWVDADNLRAGDVLRSLNGEKVIVEQVQHAILEQPQTLYNFEVEDNHNYFVAESASICVREFVLVHNYCSKWRANYMKAHPDEIIEGFDIHHQIPQKWRVDFGKVGIDVDDASFLQKIGNEVHRGRASSAYNKAWTDELSKATNKGTKKLTADMVLSIWDKMKNFFPD